MEDSVCKGSKISAFCRGILLLSVFLLTLELIQFQFNYKQVESLSTSAVDRMNQIFNLTRNRENHKVRMNITDVRQPNMQQGTKPGRAKAAHFTYRKSKTTIDSETLFFTHMMKYNISNDMKLKSKQMMEPPLDLESRINRVKWCLKSKKQNTERFWDMISERLLAHTFAPKGTSKLRVISVLIGAMKSGTTESRFYMDRFSEGMRLYQNHNHHRIIKHSVRMPDTLIIDDETHHFPHSRVSWGSRCRRWTQIWERYPSKMSRLTHHWRTLLPLIKNESDRMTHSTDESSDNDNFSVIWEKTPKYCAVSQTAVFLGVTQRLLTEMQISLKYKDRLRLRIWMLTRDPTLRLYSHYWQHWNKGDGDSDAATKATQSRSKEGFIQGARSLIQMAKEKSNHWRMLTEEVTKSVEKLNRFRNQSELMNKTSDDIFFISKNSNMTKDDDLRYDWMVDGVVESYMQLKESDSILNAFPLGSFPLRRGVYAPQILMYMRCLGIIDDRGRVNKGDQFTLHSFRVIQSEYQWRDLHATTETVAKWIYGFDLNVNLNLNQNWDWFRNVSLIKNRKNPHRNYPKLNNPKVFEEVASFYRPYNQLLSLVWWMYGDIITFGHPFQEYSL